MKTDLSTYNNNWYRPGNALRRVLWYFVNISIFKSALFPVNGLKRSLLRLFGATVGKGVVIKPGVSIKYPWFLSIGDHCWIGEQVWIDNLGQVNIGNHVCISQGAFLLCGNHNYSSASFDLMVEPITLEDGVWIGAKAVVCPGTLCKTHAVLSVQSVATGVLESYSIYRGNPAVKIRERVIG
ncbi:MAG: colanic acid biosynthesis acetyltransferase WcaF [Chitinophagaceae bacterium]|nr:MAG: colanic acid biosynthesis acetyltransferase WcaF [Chitinophagaceae bacterium]